MWLRSGSRWPAFLAAALAGAPIAQGEPDASAPTGTLYIAPPDSGTVRSDTLAYGLDCGEIVSYQKCTEHRFYRLRTILDKAVVASFGEKGKGLVLAGTRAPLAFATTETFEVAAGAGQARRTFRFPRPEALRVRGIQADYLMAYAATMRLREAEPISDVIGSMEYVLWDVRAGRTLASGRVSDTASLLYASSGALGLEEFFSRMAAGAARNAPIAPPSVSRAAAIPLADAPADTAQPPPAPRAGDASPGASARTDPREVSTKGAPVTAGSGEGAAIAASPGPAAEGGGGETRSASGGGPEPGQTDSGGVASSGAQGQEPPDSLGSRGGPPGKGSSGQQGEGRGPARPQAAKTEAGKYDDVEVLRPVDSLEEYTLPQRRDAPAPGKR